MKKAMYVGIVSVIFQVVISGITLAAPVQWADNGHYYEIITPNSRIAWEQAKIEAAGKTHLGLQGHLATITSLAENYFISYAPELGNGTNDSGIEDKWLGGFQPDGSIEPGGGWQWITGEIFNYTNWASFEPNNNPGGENAIIFQHGWTDGHGKQWNDLTSSWTQSGYIIEYEAANPVPEPGTILLVGIGLIALASLRKRQE